MANLPADLPTNWTQGQIISPNGTEVGLTEQYGYNYLNEQVNNTQTEVNSLSTAQTNTQQQVNTLNTQVGNIQGQVTTQGQSITALQGTTASQGQSITSLQSQVSSNDTDIAGLQQTTTTQGQNITTLQGQVSTLNQTTTTQGESITSLQSEVSAINTALDSVAQESSVQDIIDSIGATTDTGGSATAGTLMAKMNNMLSNNNLLIPAIMGHPDYTTYANYIENRSTVSLPYTIFSVSGDGYFSGVAGFFKTVASVSHNVAVQIIIDGETVYTSTMNANQTSDENCSFGVVNNNYLITSDGYASFGEIEISAYNDALMFFVPPISDKNLRYSDYNYYFTNEIPFNESLEVKIISTYGSPSVTTIGIQYCYHVKNT